MLPRNADRAFARFQRTRDPRALARVFDRTAPELLRLARHLATGEAAAEDLVQATFVTAIETAPNHRPGLPVLPWLVGILGNHARAARRRDRRPLDPDRAGRDDVADPAAEAEGRELSAAVHATIAGLPPPYRPVLRLYLEHGLEPIEIARSLERPPGTVRAQVARGLDLLRAALPAILGAGSAIAAGPARGLSAVREAVLGCEPAGTSVATFTTLGVLTMTQWKFLAGAAALAAAGWSIWYTTDIRGEAQVPRDSTVPPATLAAGPPKPKPEDVAARAAPGRVAAAAPGRESVSPWRELRVAVRYDDAAGTPAAGVGVRLTSPTHLGRPQLDGALATDDEGVVRFTDPAPGEAWLSIERAALRRRVDLAPDGVSEVALTIPALVTVEGTVRDLLGAPVPGASVLVHGISPLPELAATSDTRGRFAVRDLAPRVMLQARCPGHSPSLAHPVQGRPGARVTLDLALGAPGRRILGHVLTPEGVPAAGVWVGCVRAQYRPTPPGAPFAAGAFTVTASDGRFTIDDGGAEELVVVAMPRERGDAAPVAAAVTAGNGDFAVDLRLRRSATLRGVIDGGGEEPGLSVQAFAVEPRDAMGYLANVLGSYFVPVDADGSYHLEGLMPGRYQLSVQRVQVLARHELDVADGDDLTWSPSVLDRLPLRVAVSPKAPPCGQVWMAHLYRRAADGNLEFLNFNVPDRDGVVTFATPDATKRYDVVVGLALGGPSNHLVVARLEDVAPQVEPHPLAIAADALPSARLRGRVVDAQGTPRASVTVVARTNVAALLLSQASVTTDAEGRFDVGPLPPGAWTVLLGEPPSARVLTTKTLAADEVAELGDVVGR